MQNKISRHTLFSFLVICSWIMLFVNKANAQSQPYRSVENEMNLPGGRDWGAVSWVYPDMEGYLWVLDRCGANTCLGSDLDPILKFDSNGNLVDSFGGGIFAWPHSLHIDHEGNIWITDASGDWIDDAEPYLDKNIDKGHAIYKFSQNGELLLVLGEPGVKGSGTNHFSNPTDVTVARNGDIFVADGHEPGGNFRIVKFDKNGRYLKEWGKQGDSEGEFAEPHSIAMDSKGRLFVADRGNNRIQIFDQEGNYLEQWTQFGRPSGIYIDQRDVIVVADSESNYERNPGWERGIRIGSVKDGWVRYFIPDTEPYPDDSGTSGAEFAIIDMDGNVYGAEVGPRNLRKYISLWPVFTGNN